MSLIKLKNNALANLTSFEGSASLGDMVFISSATASSSASIEFTSGIDSTYKEYVFYWVNIHPQNDGVDFQFNMSTDGGSNYNVTKTSTAFNAYHKEDATISGLGYSTADDLAQSTAFQNISINTGNANDENVSGYLHLFNPSSTTFVKHFICRNHETTLDDYAWNFFISGYGNTTSAINSIKFQMSSGNIDDGKILMFGLN